MADGRLQSTQGVELDYGLMRGFRSTDEYLGCGYYSGQLQPAVRLGQIQHHLLESVADLNEHFQAAPGELQATLHRLIRVGHAADGYRLGFPTPGGKLAPQEFRRVFLHHDLRLEIEAR